MNGGKNNGDARKAADEELEKSDIVFSDGETNEEVRLPIGWRFSPTDEQLVNYYLVPKAFNRRLPNKAMKEISGFFARDPQELTGGEEDNKFLFSKGIASYSEKYWTRSGDWVFVHTKNRALLDQNEEFQAYYRSTYKFFDRVPEEDPEFTDWKMHIYSLNEFKLCATENEMKEDGDAWVAIRVYRRPKTPPSFDVEVSEDEDDEENDEEEENGEMEYDENEYDEYDGEDGEGGEASSDMVAETELPCSNGDAETNAEHTTMKTLNMTKQCPSCTQR